MLTESRPSSRSTAGGRRPGVRAPLVALGALLGAVAGLALVVARIANAASYLSSSPETCLNCHVMNDAFSTWQRSSHARAAVCNDCHVPHANPVGTWGFKAADGLRHSAVFTLRREPQVLRLSEGARPVVQANCLRCHADRFAMVRLAASSERACWDCHDNIHGPVRSLSASPHLRRPALPAAGLDWTQEGRNP